MAAGYLLIKEAGGLIVDANSQSLDTEFGIMTRLSFVGAANQATLDQIMSEINK
jgi:myo-inositol-1(or 4)-monophosphatase